MTDVEKEEITSQLRRIVASRDFTDSPRLVQFLEYVVAQSLKGRPSRIKQYEIAVEALGYDQDFDPSSNPSVRIMARRLRRALKRYYSSSGSMDPIRIKLPKGGYTPVFADNLEEEKHQVSDHTSAATRSGPAKTHELNIAIFELETLGGGESDSIFSAGLTSELLVAMTRFEGISVLGPFSFASQPPLDWRHVYNDYGAPFGLKGWIQTQGRQIRISMELVETRNGKSQWAQTFRYDLDETSLFDIQDEITGLVSGAVADGVGAVFRLLNTHGYANYLRTSDMTNAVLSYNHAWATHGPGDWQRAYEEVGNALALHPEDALLNALQANIHYGNVMHDMGLDPESLEKMKKLAKKAIALDPTLQIAQYNAVVINAYFDRTDACVRAARKTVAMNPNHARILAGCAVATTSVGAYDLGRELIEKAKLLNPHYPGWYHFVDFVMHAQDEQFEHAWENAQLIFTPGLIWQPLIRAAALGMLGRDEDAWPYLEELLQIKPEFLQRPREYLRPLFVTDAHVEMVWDGLCRAGVKSVNT